MEYIVEKRIKYVVAVRMWYHIQATGAVGTTPSLRASALQATNEDEPRRGDDRIHPGRCSDAMAGQILV